VPPPKQKAAIGGVRWAVRWAVRWRHTELGGKYFAESCTGRLGGRLGGGTVILIGKYFATGRLGGRLGGGTVILMGNYFVWGG
jgi:hypothetical protein